MEEDWTKIHSTRNKFEADILKGMLEDKGIKTVLLNKKDSSYNLFGDIELYTHINYAEKALAIINETNLE